MTPMLPPCRHTYPSAIVCRDQRLIPIYTRREPLGRISQLWDAILDGLDTPDQSSAITTEPGGPVHLVARLQVHSAGDDWGLRTLRVEKIISLMVSEGSVSAPACMHTCRISASVSRLCGCTHAVRVFITQLRGDREGVTVIALPRQLYAHGHSSWRPTSERVRRPYLPAPPCCALQDVDLCTAMS